MRFLQFCFVFKRFHKILQKSSRMQARPQQISGSYGDHFWRFDESGAGFCFWSPQKLVNKIELGQFFSEVQKRFHNLAKTFRNFRAAERAGLGKWLNGGAGARSGSRAGGKQSGGRPCIKATKTTRANHGGGGRAAGGEFSWRLDARAHERASERKSRLLAWTRLAGARSNIIVHAPATIGRAIERSSERPIKRSSDRANTRATDRSRHRAIERPS